MPLRRAALRVLLALPVLIPGGPLRGQLPPLTVPRGHVRVDAFGGFAAHDRRFRDGVSEDAASDFARDPAGRTLFPALWTADSLLARITGDAGAALHLGRTEASQLVVIGTGGIGLAWGLTSRITLFGNVPIVRVRVRSTFALDSVASEAGLNLANPIYGDGAGQGQAGLFFTEFDASLAALATRLQNGDYDGDPAQRALAQETLARGQALRGDLFALMIGTGGGSGVANLFLPTRTSALGIQVLNTVTALQATLSGPLSVNGFTQALPLPERRVGHDDLAGLIANPEGPFRGTLETPRLAALGDIELGAAVSLVDAYRPETRMGVRLATQGLVRLRTSRRGSTSRFFDVGTGDRQPDLELTLVGDVFLNRVGVRLLGGYTLQLPGQAQARIAPPGEPFPVWDRLAAVEYDLGDVITAGVQPYVRLADNFGITGGFTWRKRGADEVTLVAGQDEIPGAPAGLLVEESERTWTTAAAGLTYSAPARIGGRPLDAGVWWEGVVAATGGRVPRTSTIRFLLRVYHKP